MRIDTDPVLPRALNRPGEVGQLLAEVDTPCLLLDLDALERHIDTMAEFVATSGVRLRASTLRRATGLSQPGPAYP